MESLDVRLRTYMPLWGQWMLGNRIYHSGRCSVYLLHCNRLKEERTCVVKAVTLLDSGDALQEKLGMALEEICAMERLQDCENIVAIQDDLEIPLRDSRGELLGYDVLIRMERLECLAERMREGELLEPEEIQRLGCELCRGLLTAHSMGIIHRDIKPGNIYRTANGVYQLGDFSVSKRTKTPILETMTGTAAYMAPEIARGDAYDSRADLYSLGIVLYQLLNHNFLPMTDERTGYLQRENAMRRRWNGASLPKPLAGGRRLQRVVLRCCAPDPDKRYASADAVWKALEDAERGSGWKQAAVIGWGCALLAAAALAVLPFLPAKSAPQGLPPDHAAEAPAADAVEEQEVTYRYTVVQTQMTWDEARIYCESRGGHLATILNQEQFDTVSALLEEQRVYTAWLGASNFSPSGGFQWVTGDPFEFAVWGLGEPNNSNNAEHYLMMYWREDQGWIWNDSSERGMWNFEAKYCGFVCQWDDTDG